MGGFARAYNRPSLQKRRNVFAGASIGIFVLGLPVASLLSPVDWIQPTKSVRASGYLNGYRIDYVQTPGGDFYRDVLEIFGPRGNSAIVVISPDNAKCWHGSAYITEASIEFNCFPWGKIAALDAAWLNENMSACTWKDCDLTSEYFNN